MFEYFNFYDIDIINIVCIICMYRYLNIFFLYFNFNLTLDEKLEKYIARVDQKFADPWKLGNSKKNAGRLT